MANSKASPPGGSDVMMYVMHVPGGSGGAANVPPN